MASKIPERSPFISIVSPLSWKLAVFLCISWNSSSVYIKKPVQPPKQLFSNTTFKQIQLYGSFPVNIQKKNRVKTRWPLPLTALLPVERHWAWGPQGEGTHGSDWTSDTACWRNTLTADGPSLLLTARDWKSEVEDWVTLLGHPGTDGFRELLVEAFGKSSNSGLGNDGLRTRNGCEFFRYWPVVVVVTHYPCGNWTGRCNSVNVLYILKLFEFLSYRQSLTKIYSTLKTTKIHIIKKSFKEFNANIFFLIVFIHTKHKNKRTTITAWNVFYF